MYNCDELSGFIRECISDFEKLPLVKVEETLNGFINRFVRGGLYQEYL